MTRDEAIAKLDASYTAAKCAILARDDQLTLEHLYYVREWAWEINSTILAARWDSRPRLPQLARRETATIDDLLV